MNDSTNAVIQQVDPAQNSAGEDNSSTPSTPSAQNTQRRWTKWLFPVAAAAVFAVSVSVWSVQTNGAKAAGEERAASIVALESELLELKGAQAELADRKVAQAAGAPSGDLAMSLERIERDQKMLGEFLETVFTWDSTPTYEAARSTVMREYNVSEKDKFLTSFFPPAPVNVDANGVEYPYIEVAHLNSMAGNYTITPLNVTGDEYSYLMKIMMIGTSREGSTQAARENILLATTNADGEMTSVSGWASPTPERESGTDHAGEASLD